MSVFADAMAVLMADQNMAVDGFIDTIPVRVILADADEFASAQGLSVTRRDTTAAVRIAEYADNPRGLQLIIGAKAWLILDARQDVEATTWQMSLRDAD